MKARPIGELLGVLKPRLARLAVTCSVLFCILMGVLWFVSYRRYDRLQMEPWRESDQRGSVLSIGSQGGRLQLLYEYAAPYFRSPIADRGYVWLTNRFDPDDPRFLGLVAMVTAATLRMPRRPI